MKSSLKKLLLAGMLLVCGMTFAAEDYLDCIKQIDQWLNANYGNVPPAYKAGFEKLGRIIGSSKSEEEKVAELKKEFPKAFDKTGDGLPPLDLKRIAADEEKGIVFSEDKRTLIRYNQSTVNDLTYVIPNGVTAVGDEAFSKQKLTFVKIPDGVTTIGKRAFYFCEKLTRVNIPSSVTSIGKEAFNM